MEEKFKKLKKIILNEFESELDLFLENVITDGIDPEELIEDLGMIRVIGKGDFLIIIAAVPDGATDRFRILNPN